MKQVSSRSIVPVVNKVRFSDKKQDAAYWRSRPPEERIAALEAIRQEYHQWKQDAESRLQRVYSIVKRS